MKLKNLGALVVLMSLTAFLSACGGSSDDGAGSQTTFSVTPAKKGVSAVGACYVGYVGRFQISGGLAPYRLTLSDPDAFSFSNADATNATTWANTAVVTARVGNRDGTFDLWAFGICVDPSSVIVLDDLGRRTEVVLTNKAS